VQVFDDPNAMMDHIIALNDYRNKARVVAGYCWDWVSKKQGTAGDHDIVFEEFGFRRHWNLSTDGSLWVQVPSSVHEVGCIHTCQGLEVDHIGVIIGPDLVVRDGRVVVRPEMRSRQDQSIKGYKKLLGEDPREATARAERIVKNTYRTLMSRGQRGCYLFCTDAETAEYFKRAGSRRDG